VVLVSVEPGARAEHGVHHRVRLGDELRAVEPVRPRHGDGVLGDPVFAVQLEQHRVIRRGAVAVVAVGCVVVVERQQVGDRVQPIGGVGRVRREPRGDQREEDETPGHR